jgi:D-3-phosphoglycerate dehydrogenase / 2-oxoglutarate reductase
MRYTVAISTSSFAQQDSSPLRLLEEAGVTIKLNPYNRRLTEQEIIQHLDGADGLLAGLEPLNRKVFEHSTKLKAIARVGIGMANVDLKAAEVFGIKVSNTPDGPTHAVAEMTLTAALMLSRNVPETNRKMHEGQWAKTISRGLSGQQVLFVGYGRIGRATADLMRPFGVTILVADPYIDPGNLSQGEACVTLEEGLPRADIVSLHASGNDLIIGEEQFRLMKQGVILLNSARGELVSEEALIRAFDSGKVAGAWFDAFWEEPYKGRLLHYDNMLLTPHVCTYTEQCRLSMEMDAVNNLLRDLGL